MCARADTVLGTQAMSWSKKTASGLDASEKQSFGKGVFRKCDGCGETLVSERFSESFEVCPLCGKHHKLSARGFRELFLDGGRIEAWDQGLVPKDPLRFSDGKPYPDRVAASQKNTQSKEGIETGLGHMGGLPVAYGAFVFAFMGGSMGSVVGEKIARLFERATDENLPVVLLQASGGARMQEGILSLMQMAKTVAARERLRDKGLPFVSVLLHPTTGGVAASFAFLGDVNIAEPGALIGFAGPRVIENTIRQKLPDGFQTSEFLLDHGMVDRITSRLAMKSEIVTILTHLGYRTQKREVAPQIPAPRKSQRKLDGRTR
jgi:acetyl-CoA carboxylase carboxyl transferase subunit beta